MNMLGAAPPPSPHPEFSGGYCCALLTSLLQSLPGTRREKILDAVTLDILVDIPVD